MRKGLWRSAQIVIAGVVAVIVWRVLARHWDEFRSLKLALTLEPGWIAFATMVTFAAYAIQIEAWRRILAGWAQHLSYSRAARIWLFVNLGRYVPGKVWSVAGLIVLAQRAGVEAWAAGASAFAIQAVALGTAVAVVAAANPGAESPLRLASAAIVAVVTIALLASVQGAGWLAGLAGRADRFRPLPFGAVAASAGLMFASWLVYGVAFWLLARGLGLSDALPLRTAAGVFALGCVLGLLALFAPGGLGVREVVFIGLLTPAVGSGHALALSLGSRILLTLCEVVAPLGLIITRQSKEDIGVHRAPIVPRPERGIALLEVLVALAILAAAGMALVGVVSAGLRAEREARERERILAVEERLLSALTLLKREDLDRRIGRHPLGEFIVDVARPERTLYRLALVQARFPNVEDVVTVVYRPAPTHAP